MAAREGNQDDAESERKGERTRYWTGAKRNNAATGEGRLPLSDPARSQALEKEARRGRRGCPGPLLVPESGRLLLFLYGDKSRESWPEIRHHVVAS